MTDIPLRIRIQVAILMHVIDSPFSDLTIPFLTIGKVSFVGCLLIGLVGSFFERERVDWMKAHGSSYFNYRSPFLFDSRVGNLLAKT